MFVWLGFLFSFFPFPQSLQVVSISPSFNEIASDSNPQIIVEFNTAIEPTTFDSISFFVFGERTGYHRGELNFLNGNTTVSFVSNNNFNAGERVIVSLSTKIQSQQGDSIKGFKWTFRIPAKQKILNFSEPVNHNGGGKGMQCIDMNNDGNPDVVTSSGIILINDGNGEFSTSWYLDDADSFYPIIVDDYNRDGFIDVFYGNDNNLILGLGNGLGSFIKTYYPGWFYYFTSADINCDGYPDIIGGDQEYINPPNDTTSFISIAFNDGTGNFNDTIRVGQFTGNVQGITTTDVDNDGDIDLLVISHLAITPGPVLHGLDGLAVFRNNGEGIFDNHQLYPADIYFPVFFPYSLYSSDFNNDGLTDIAVLGDMGGAITLNKGNGFFATGSDTANLREFWGAELHASFTGGDFNGDTWIDLACSGYSSIPWEPSPRNYRVLQNCNSYFMNCSNFFDTLGTDEALVYGTASVDIDKDNDLDLVHSGNGVFITLNKDTVSSIDNNYVTLNQFTLYQNFPNPFNSQTNIDFELDRSEFIRLAVYNIIGKEVRLLANNLFLPGKQRIVWDGKDNYGIDLPSGVYLIKANFSVSFKIIKTLFLK